MKIISLTYLLDPATPLYGNRGEVDIYSLSKIEDGNPTNNCGINFPLHSGTHIDFPKHFFEHGQSLENFNHDFWIFNEPLILEIDPTSYIIKDEIEDQLKETKQDHDILIIKTGSGKFRTSDRYIFNNYGLHPSLADLIRERLPNVRLIVLDTISISSYTNRELGREAHRKFLDPQKPILIVEDANLESLDMQKIEEIIISPLLIRGVDGVPCNIIAKVKKV